ncbi:MAG: DUF1343 domain-containing protein [Acidobacteria bacterium]|nr:DUF1343 domain-containing protein [Acidobacteriota bacterium]
MRTVTLLLAALAAVAQERYTGSADLDRVINEAITAQQIPGAVAMIGQPGKVLHRAAYGKRVLVPAEEPMTVDTIFDAASLTKVVSCTAAVMRLFEQGKIRLSDPVTAYLPEFQRGKSEITIRQLLTHFSGLRPDVDLKPAWSGYQTGINLALIDKPAARPGERFIYSDINFILLGEIVRRLSGKTLPLFVTDEVWRPLGMSTTMYQPPASLHPRIAPTEYLEGTKTPLRGKVHDETTRFMGGIAGHAGMFTTAADLSRYAGMMLGEGKLEGVRVFQAATVKKFTEPASPPNHTLIRALGWDIDTQYSANRGELFPIGSYGHTGFTGTSLWIDPVSKTYVILLANSVHPVRRPPISALRSKVATIAAVHAGIETAGVALTGYNETLAGAVRATARNGTTLTGLDVLVREKFARLQGKRAGLVTNHTGISRDGKRNLDLMAAAGVNLAVVFSPEHGIAGTLDDENVADSKDAATGVPVRSLYRGKDRKPSAESLKALDVVVFDIQDAGARFYTYMCTMLNVLEAAGEAGVPVMVLDRPNPITGTVVEPPMLEMQFSSFVGCYPLPLRHGMTLGELAGMMNAERKLGAKLEVVKMQGWQRGDWWDSTGLPWINPSPNIRGLHAATLYPGVAMLEYSRNYTVGRGTDAPFEHVGAEWIDGPQLAGYLNARSVPGVRVYPVRFKPASSNLAGKDVQGVRFQVTQREVFNSAGLGLEVAAALLRLYPGKIDLKTNAKLIANSGVIEALARGDDPRTVLQRETDTLGPFLARRGLHLLY